MIASNKPTNIPNCLIWFDFSDLSTITSVTISPPASSQPVGITMGTLRGGEISDGDFLWVASDKASGYQLIGGVMYGNGPGIPFSTPRNARVLNPNRPKIRFNGINGLPSLSFGELKITGLIEQERTFNSIGFSASRSAMYRDTAYCWTRFSPPSQNSFSQSHREFDGQYSDTERTIFYVYQSIEDQNYPLPDGEVKNMSSPSSTKRNSPDTFNNVPPGAYGTILSISSVADRWYTTSSNPFTGVSYSFFGQFVGLTFSGVNDNTSHSLYGMSFLYLTKYSSGSYSGTSSFTTMRNRSPLPYDYHGTDWTVCNWVNSVDNTTYPKLNGSATNQLIAGSYFFSPHTNFLGLTVSGGLTNNGYAESGFSASLLRGNFYTQSQFWKIYDPVNKPSLFTFRCKDSNDDGLTGNYSMVDIRNGNTFLPRNTEGYMSSRRDMKWGISASSVTITGNPTPSTIIYQSGTSSPSNRKVGMYVPYITIGNTSRDVFRIPPPSGTDQRNLTSNDESGLTGEYYESFNRFGFQGGGFDSYLHRDGGGFRGLVGEFIYFNRRLTDEEMSTVNNYLKRKWNIM